jgi:hypothetical protein
MTIEISKPFESYVAEDTLPRTGDARRFVFNLVFDIEGTNRTDHISREWKYSGTQEAIQGEPGLHALRKQHMEAFEVQVRRHLREKGLRLYAVGDKPMLICAPAKKQE